MKRLFIAISASSGIQKAVQHILKKLRMSADKRELSIKWSKLENLHITLSFLGSIEEDKIQKISLTMDKLCQQRVPFHLSIKGLNGFPEVRGARSIYLDVQRSQNLLDLQSVLEAELNVLGFQLDDRNYVPHLTLGRLRNPKSVEDMISPFVRKYVGELEVNEIVLFESIQTGPFSIYKKIHESKINFIS